MTETYQFEELDGETRDYLSLAKERNGKGMPGIFVGKSSYWPVIGLILGFVILVATVLFTFPPTAPPMKEAMLQTAGFLLGGWMIVAALRVWASRKHVGHFVYADADNLYEAKGGRVQVTDLQELRDARAVQNFNEGNYQNTMVTLKVGRDVRTVEVKDEERGRRLTVFLNSVSYMRDGGEDGKDEELKKLSPEAMGAVAKEVARTGEFPRDLRATEEGEMARVPRPKREGRRSTGMLAILVTILIGVGMFFGFRAMNGTLRETAIFDRIKSLPEREQPPELRKYLMNPEFTARRDDAQKLLDSYYDRAVENYVKGEDPECKKGFAETVRSLKKKPQPVATLIVSEDESPAGLGATTATREKAVQTLLADKFGSTVGDELVVFAAPTDPEKPNSPDKKSKGMIDVRWKFNPDGSVKCTLEFRNSPDEAPTVVKSFTVPQAMPAANPFGPPEMPDTSLATVQAMANRILTMTVGPTRIRPMPPPVEDF